MDQHEAIHQSTSNESSGKSPVLSEAFGDVVPDLDLTLWDLFYNTAISHPHRDAIVSLWQSENDPLSASQCIPDGNTQQKYLRWSYSELLDRAERLAESLRNLGCRPGMRLAVGLSNSAEWGLLFWAAAKLRMAFVPIDVTVPQDARAMLRTLKPHAVVAQDAEGATALDHLDVPLGTPTIRVLCTSEQVDSWLNLCDLVVHKECQYEVDSGFDEGGSMSDDGEGVKDKERAALIVFTSGTTGNPKGCLHTDGNLISQCCDFDPEINASGPLRWLIHTPVSHIFAINNSLRAWRFGGTAVFPSRTFDVDQTLKALVLEQCSVVSATPTLVKALMAHPSFPSPEQLDLRIITIGGTSIGPEHIQLCRQGLGARCAIQVYGMSEGAPIVTWRKDDPDLVDGWHPGVGKVLPGASVRVCQRGTQHVLPRSEIGELHIGGTSVIKSYLGDDNGTSVYVDDLGHWLATGDQAKMDEKGIIYILGRYKDLIIRGGENIYPVKIEANLEEIDGLQAQVIGVADDVAGQVPVAVVTLPEGVNKAQVLEKSANLGSKYTLDAVYTLEELGLDKFPATSLGKVKKRELSQRVSELYRKTERSQQEPAGPFVAELLDIWERLVGSRPCVTESVKFFADSIILLRYCDNVLRICDQRLYLQDLFENDTVEKQASLLLSRQTQSAKLVSTTEVTVPHSSHVSPLVKPSRQQPMSTILEPALESPWSGDSDTVVSAKEAISNSGLSPALLEDVLPIRHSLHRAAIGLRPQAYHNRMVFRIGNVGTNQVRMGLERALRSRPILRTIVYRTRNGLPFHAVLVSDASLFRKLIHESYLTEEQAWRLFQDGSANSHSSPFMFQANMVSITGQDSHFLSLTFNHSVFDALSITQWHQELGFWIQDSALEIPPLTPYRLFCDMFSRYEGSEPAKENVAFHVKRLRGVSRYSRALWPPQKAPGMMICNDEDSPHARERQLIRDRVWNGNWANCASEFQYPRSGRVVGLPGLVDLQKTHTISPSLFTKSAILLFNVLTTGSSHAILNTWESGRSWPFVPKWMEKLLPPAMSIDGPTVQWILNMAEIDRSESVVEFLRRMFIEHEQMKQHEHAPWNHIVEALADEGHVAEAASFRQSFVWDVSMGIGAHGCDSGSKTLEPVARYDWPDCGFFWNAFMVDSTNLYFIASWDTAQLNDREVDAHCDSLADVMRKLADKGNWNRSIGSIFGI